MPGADTTPPEPSFFEACPPSSPPPSGVSCARRSLRRCVLALALSRRRSRTLSSCGCIFKHKCVCICVHLCMCMHVQVSLCALGRVHTHRTAYAHTWVIDATSFAAFLCLALCTLIIMYTMLIMYTIQNNTLSHTYTTTLQHCLLCKQYTTTLLITATLQHCYTAYYVYNTKQHTVSNIHYNTHGSFHKHTCIDKLICTQILDYCRRLHTRTHTHTKLKSCTRTYIHFQARTYTIGCTPTWLSPPPASYPSSSLSSPSVSLLALEGLAPAGNSSW